MIEKKIIVCFSVAILAVMLVGCTVGGYSEYSEKTVSLGKKCNIIIEGDGVIYDKDVGCNNLIIALTVENTGKKGYTYQNKVRIRAYQGDKKLKRSELKGLDGKPYCSVFDEDSSTEFNPGDIMDLVYGWKLVDDSPVRVVFHYKGLKNKDAELVFDVKGSISEDIGYVS